jgi:hypothetical protein
VRLKFNGRRLAFVADFGTQNYNLINKFDMENKTSINHENGNDANRLLCAVAYEEFVENFTSDGELTPIDIVSEINGLTYNEIRSCSKIVRVP